MTKNNLHNPHDALLRRQLQNIEVARAMLRRAVPECVRSDIQWETLAIENSSFVSPDLQSKESDLVFSAKLGSDKPLKVMVYMELESAAKHNFMIRFQRYIALAIESIYRDNPREKLPLIVPLCLYTGVKPFPYSTSLMDYFEAPDLAEKLLYAPITMIDVAKMGDEVLDFDKVSILMALPVMARTKQFLAWFQEQLEQDRLQSYLEAYGKDEAESIILYIINFMPPKEREKVFDMLQRKMPHYTEEVRSVADVIRLEGFEDGMEKGIEKGIEKGAYQKSIKFAKNLILKNFGFQEISELTDLPLDTIEQLAREVGDN